MRMQDLPIELQQRMCHASPLAWANLALGSFVRPYPHLRYVESKLVRVGTDIHRLRVSQPPQSGKQLAHSTPVLTTAGWKNHGDLRPGDEVFGLDGLPKKVLAISESTWATLEVRFANGERIKCHPNHEWYVRDRRTMTHRVLGTQEMLAAGLLAADGESQFFTPVPTRDELDDSFRVRIGHPDSHKEVARFVIPRPSVGITDIEPCQPERGRCIQVEGGIYLVGRQLVPTHNSLLVSTAFPTWYLGKNPDARILCVSYGAKRAHDLGSQTKEMFANWAGPIFGVEMDASARSKEFWKVKGHRGYFMSTGIGGPANGFPADMILFDDPYGSPEDALSPAGRKTVERFVTSVLAARLQKWGSWINVSTRWHADDIIGWTKKQERTGTAKWHEIVLQALPESDRYDEETGQLIQKAGESICEDLKPKAFLEEIKNACTYFEWMSLWQNTPVSAEGSLWEASMFNEEVWVDHLPRKCDSLVVAVDPAMGTDLANGDYSAIVAVATTGDGLFYTDCDIEITGPEDTMDRLVRFVQQLPRQPDLIGIESMGFQSLVRDIGIARLQGAGIHVPVVALRPTMKHETTGKEVVVKKVDRISMVLDTFIREELMRYVRSRGTGRLIHQLENFPQKKYHDDGPDALEMCFRLLNQVALERREAFRMASRKERAALPIGLQRGASAWPRNARTP